MKNIQFSINKVINIIKKILIPIWFSFFTISLSSCSAFNKDAISTNYTCVRCTYDSTSNMTKIVWYSTIKNESPIDIKEVNFSFDLYEETSFIRTTGYVNYQLDIKHGKTNSGNRSFTTIGHITNAEVSTWYATFSTFWETYEGWMIAGIVATSLLSIVYIAFMILEDADFEDFLCIFLEYPWLFLLLIPYVGVGVYSYITSSWIPIVIAVISLFATIILILTAHLMRFIVYSILDAIPNNKHKIDANDKQIVKINKDKDFSSFTLAELKEYCRNNRIKGYSGLSKNELIEYIANYNNQDIQNKVKPRKINKTFNSNITFESIAGLSKAKEVFREKVVLPFEHPELFEKFGKKAGGGILLYGLPGTGKTMFAEAAANELEALFIPIKCSDIKSKWYGESEQNIKNVFKKARQAERAIIFFDEFEAIGSKRTDSSDNLNNSIVPEILAEMQGVGTNDGKSTIIVIAATNKPWMLDSAFLRPGRFDEKILIPLPDFEARKKLFEIQLLMVPIEKDIDFNHLANITLGFNGADIKEFCEKLKMSAIKRTLEKGEEQSIGMEDVLNVQKEIKSSVSNDDVEQLAIFEQQ